LWGRVKGSNILEDHNRTFHNALMNLQDQ
jgi:hypothetical protein